MSLIFLASRLADPSRQPVSGGQLSNNVLLEDLSDRTDLHIFPLQLLGTPPNLEKKEFTLHPPFFKNAPGQKIRLFSEKHFVFKHRTLKRIRRIPYPRGIIGCRSTTPLAYDLSRTTGLPFALITRAFENHELTGTRPPYDEITLERRIDSFFSRKKIIQAYKNADLILTNSNFLAKETRACFATDSETIVLHPQPNLPTKAPYISSIERVGFVNKGNRKGKTLFLALAHEFPHFLFYSFGSPLQADLPDNVVECGYIPDREQLFQTADLFLMPSYWDEPYGRVAAEALTFGKPVLVSKRGGLLESAPDSLFWVGSDAIKEWKEKIELLLDHPKETEKSITRCQDELTRQKKNYHDNVNWLAYSWGL